MTRRGGSHWWERWAPFIFTLTAQLIAGVLFAGHLSDQGSQNAKDIAELKVIVVPRPEILAMQQATKDQLDRIETLLLTAKEDKK